jgi:hypothetical protein
MTGQGSVSGRCGCTNPVTEKQWESGSRARPAWAGRFVRISAKPLAARRKLERGMPTAALAAKSWPSGEPDAQVVAY